MMKIEDVDLEIDRLNQKKVEITNKMNLTTDFDEIEILKEELKNIQTQIEVLEKFKNIKK